MVNAYLKRPEGLIYQVDGNGTPIYMAGAAPTNVYKLASAIAPGQNVTMAISPSIVTPYTIGEVWILDAGAPALQEACVVVAVTPPNMVTFGTVLYAHQSGATASAGLTITEERNLPSKRSIARVAKWPVVNVQSVLGRYAYGRRSDQVGGLYQEMNLLAAVQTFGGPPQWIPVPIAQVDWSGANQNGEIWIPAGMLIAYYSDVRIRYVAGFQATALPDCIVQATAAIASALVVNSNFGGQIKSLKAAGSQMERFAASNIDADTLAHLAPYVARTFY